jgi:hypothetical protein
LVYGVPESCRSAQQHEFYLTYGWEKYPGEKALLLLVSISILFGGVSQGAASDLPVILETCDMNPGSSRPSYLKTNRILTFSLCFGYPSCLYYMNFCLISGLIGAQMNYHLPVL